MTFLRFQFCNPIFKGLKNQYQGNCQQRR